MLAQKERIGRLHGSGKLHGTFMENKAANEANRPSVQGTRGEFGTIGPMSALVNVHELQGQRRPCKLVLLSETLSSFWALDADVDPLARAADDQPVNEPVWH